ncbi:MAG TPA: HD domain-containing protein [Casimicrobiaceae bacterium]|nr:HD domain-containing protein [Casimicrobiaceae bacterium]
MPSRESLAHAEALLLEGVAFAAEKHRHQRRKDAHASPYINHPIELAILLQREGISDPVTLCAALLHDTIEDTETTAEELRAAFGPEVALVVLEVTDDKHLPKQQRKQLQIDHAHMLSQRARAVKLADKICNLRDMVESPPTGWGLARRREYFDWAKAVIDGLRGDHPHLERMFDEVHAAGVRALHAGARS